MAIPPVTARAPQAASRARVVWSWVGSIAIVIVCMFAAMSVGGTISNTDSTMPDPWRTLGWFATWIALAVSIALIWRHRFPVTIASIAIALPILFPATPLPGLVALAAVIPALRTSWQRIVFVALAWIATTISLEWDAANANSLFDALVRGAPLGTPARNVLFWIAPVLAAIMTVPFAIFGYSRTWARERDEARAGVTAATRNTNVLRDEMARERERQELARELHDTLAAKLSAVSLHAGALELRADSEADANTARLVREAAQGSLDDLRNVVHVLRNPNASLPGAGLTDVLTLIDETSAAGTNVHAQVMVNDPRSCDARVAHAAFRVVQESVSNVRRHAPGAAVRISLRGGPEHGLHLSITNWFRPGARPTSVGGGFGLTGMRERVAEVGGTFQAGATEAHAFAVVVWLPWSPR